MGKAKTTSEDLALIQARQAAEFALTPAGQQLKQFETLQRMGQVYVSSTIIPDTFKGNLGNCIIAVDMASRMNANPVMVMQNLYVVHGNPAWSSKFLIATINACGKFTPLRYEFKGDEGKDDWACRCYAYESSDRDHKEPLYGDWISLRMAKAEKWTDKSGSKWITMPGQMLRYRAAAFWQRIYAPEISMGFLTKEEAEDIAPDEQYQPENPTTSAEAAQKISAAFAKAEAAAQPAQQQPIVIDPTSGEIFNESK